MGFRPPKGVRPPQLEGKRTGRPRGSKSYARVWADVMWAFKHRYKEGGSAPSAAAFLWWKFASFSPSEFEEWLIEEGRI